MMARTLEAVKVVFEFSDGENIEAAIDAESGEWQQWGQPNDELAENVDRLTAMAKAVAMTALL